MRRLWLELRRWFWLLRAPQYPLIPTEKARDQWKERTRKWSDDFPKE